jgi:hypothetical protein
MDMKITGLWIVTKPTPISTMGDIVFYADLKVLGRQFLGGLKPEEIIGAYDNQPEAEQAGKAALASRVDNVHTDTVR